MKILGIIPARYASTRFPGKALTIIDGKTMIQRVYEQAKKAKLDRVIVATDDIRIQKEVEKWNGAVMMTGLEHQSGTERCVEVAQKLKKNGERFDVIINIQGDEPFIDPSQINQLADGFSNTDSFDKLPDILTLVKKIEQIQDVLNPNIVKAVLAQYTFDNQIHKALYFSRQAIPFIRDIDPSQWLTRHTFYKHIGLYAFKSSFLESDFLTLGVSLLESVERLEQLRWLEANYTIGVLKTELETIGIDTPEDLLKI